MGVLLQEHAQADPEATARGRRRYLGRQVAGFMPFGGADWLVRAERDNEEDVTRLRAWLDVQEGASVADFGCGNGFHTLPIAESVGPTGRVYGVDLQSEMLAFLAERAQAQGLENVVPIQSTVDDPKLPEKSCDFVLLVDVYHELSHPVRVLGALKKALTEDGVIVLVEFRAEDRSVPIKPRHKMSKAQVIAEMAANGWSLAAETDALPWQHAMAFEPAAAEDSTGDSAGDEQRNAPLEARAMAMGFLDAMGLEDPRVVYPFLGAKVNVGEAALRDGKALSVEIGRHMKASEAPLIPPDTGLSWTALPGGAFEAELLPPEGTKLHEERSVLTMERGPHGVFRVSGWRKPGRPR